MAVLGALVQVDIRHNFDDVVIDLRLYVHFERTLAAVQALPSYQQTARVAVTPLDQG